MRKTSIFFLGYFILEFPVLKLTQVYIFNSIWRFLHGKVRLNYSKRGIFDRLPRRSKSKFSKKEKYIPTELSPLSEKPKSLGIGLKLVEISCPNWMWLVFLVFDNFLNNWWGRRQYFSQLIHFWNPRTQIDPGVYFQLNLTIPSWKSTA